MARKRKRQPRIARADESLRRASIAVGYEVSTLASTLHIMVNGATTFDSPTSDRAVSNALLHTFLLSARNLCHFLYPHESRTTDILAEDFFDEPADWISMRPTGHAEFTDATLVNLISKRVAHLTWDRAGGTKPSWSVFAIAFQLGIVLERLVASVPAARVTPGFGEDVSALMKELRRELDKHKLEFDFEQAQLVTLFNEADFWNNPRIVDSSGAPVDEAESIRDTMKKTYDNHRRKAESGELSAPDSKPHELALYGALATRYQSGGMDPPEIIVWQELAPFLGLSDDEARDSLAEYVVFRERPIDAKVRVLSEKISQGITALDVTARTMAAMAVEQKVAWGRLLSDDARSALTSALEFDGVDAE
ncbi:MAG: hypothetical protein HOP29_06330 [Phycisphaerales bacterium]|nr:hypothetical protein [Phycisphaerales bacterium]